MEALKSIISALAFASIGISAVEIYLTVNKLWKRKHEQAVAESISIAAKSFGLIPLLIFWANFLLTSQWQGLINYSIWIFGSIAHILVATGLFVRANKKKNMLQLLLSSFKKEGGEIGYLAKSLVLPSSAELVLSILVQIAAIDGRVSNEERVFVESFASQWGVKNPWSEALAGSIEPCASFASLRKKISVYLDTCPPEKQALDLAQIIKELVSADGQIPESERLISIETTRMLLDYAEASKESDRYTVLLIPQKDEHFRAMSEIMELEKRYWANGTAFASEPYYSLEYAQMVRDQYSKLDLFAIVAPEKCLS